MLYTYVDTDLDDNLVSWTFSPLSVSRITQRQHRTIVGPVLADMLHLQVGPPPFCGDVRLMPPDCDFRTPFNEPVTTRTCFHTFCQECILQALSVSNHCPIDRSPLSVELLGQADPIVRHVRGIYVIRVAGRRDLLTGCWFSLWKS